MAVKPDTDRLQPFPETVGKKPVLHTGSETAVGMIVQDRKAFRIDPHGFSKKVPDIQAGAPR
jgi:hypothetical protein